MVNIFQIGPALWKILIILGFASIITTISVLKMVEKKRIVTFIPFFVSGLGLSLTAGFMFYDFFGVAVDIFYTFSFISVVGIFFIIWRATK